MLLNYSVLISFLLLCTIHRTYSACEGYMMVCDNISGRKIESTTLMRAPGTSQNCEDMNSETAVCRSVFITSRGQRIHVKKYLIANIQGECTDNYLQLSDTDTEESMGKYCMVENSAPLEYSTTSHKLEIYFTSSQNDNTFALQVEPYGCPTDSIVDTAKGRVRVPSFDYNWDSYDAQVTCEDNYLIENKYTHTVIRCERSLNGDSRVYRWNVTESLCNVASCPEHPVILNGYYNSPGQYPGATLSYQCQAGYTLSAETTQTCVIEHGVGAYWNGTAPTCRLVDCGPIPVIQNSTLTSTPQSTTYDSTFTYECDENMIPADTSTATCLSTGIWSYLHCEVWPIVIPNLLCKPPSKSSSWRQLPTVRNSYRVGVELTFRCLYDESVTKLRCLNQNGAAVWDKQLPVCSGQSTSNTGSTGLERPTWKDPQTTTPGRISIEIIIAIAAGVVATIAIIVVIICCIKQRRKRKMINKKKQQKTGELTIARAHSIPNPHDKPPKPKRLFLDENDTPEREAFIKPTNNNRSQEEDLNGAIANGTRKPHTSNSSVYSEENESTRTPARQLGRLAERRAREGSNRSNSASTSGDLVIQNPKMS